MDSQCLLKEIKYNYVRSSGAGGQHVNKVSTKVVLTFDMLHSNCLTTEELEILSQKLSNRISKEGIFSISVSQSRSQLKNKEKATDFFIKIFKDALRPVKKRKSTKIPKSARLKRLKKKKNRAMIKANRQKPKFD